jgi:tRNA A-37 threonylcarbamoyl transferase component Bud32
MKRRVDAPPGLSEAHRFRRHDAGKRRWWVTADWESAALSLGLLEAGGCARLLAAASGPRGRAATAVVALPGRDASLHLRAVRHGGWLAPLWGDRLLGTGRPLAELRVNAALRAAGAPVPEPVLASAERRGGPFWSAAVATVHEPDTADGLALLEAEPSPEQADRAVAAAARAIRAFHDAGGRHFDLHAGNLLFRGHDECLVVDLDKARRLERVTASARMAEIMRLYRSLVRRGLLVWLGDDACDQFLRAYTAADEDLRQALLEHLPRERARLSLHRLAWHR